MKRSKIYEDEHLLIEVQESEIPWLKIFTKEPYREFSEVPFKVKMQLLLKLDIIEREMLSYYNPIKINIASFGNHLPHVHFHIMARFENDSYFPEPMWGEKQRESKIKLKSFDEFLVTLLPKLEPEVLEEDED